MIGIDEAIGPLPPVATLPPRLVDLLYSATEYIEPESVVLVGSAAMAFRGLRDVKDLDVLVHAPGALERLTAAYPKRAEITSGYDDGGPDDHHTWTVPTRQGALQFIDDISWSTKRVHLTQADVIRNAEHWMTWNARFARVVRWSVISISHMASIKLGAARRCDAEDLALLQKHKLWTIL